VGIKHAEYVCGTRILLPHMLLTFDQPTRTQTTLHLQKRVSVQTSEEPAPAKRDGTPRQNGDVASYAVSAASTRTHSRSEARSGGSSDAAASDPHRDDLHQPGAEHMQLDLVSAFGKSDGDSQQPEGCERRPMEDAATGDEASHKEACSVPGGGRADEAYPDSHRHAGFSEAELQAYMAAKQVTGLLQRTKCYTHTQTRMFMCIDVYSSWFKRLRSM
jgi:hypothetical protein